MSYRCGVDGALAAVLGIEPGGPWVACDGCGVRRTCTKPSGMPYAWLLDNKAAPGWKLTKSDDGRRTDLCSACKQEQP